MKTGNLFNCKVENNNVLKNEVAKLNTLLNPKGVYVCLLKLNCGRALIYVFRPDKLKNDLAKDEAKILLNKSGYRCENLYDDINHLSERISDCSEFPHEIGLFLGYPIEDIKGFIEHKGKNCLCTGCWKVYCNECEAIKTFKKFKKCTDVYCRKLKEGLSIMQLTVAA
jgi:hypothetical protein